MDALVKIVIALGVTAVGLAACKAMRKPVQPDVFGQINEQSRNFTNMQAQHQAMHNSLNNF